MAEESSKDFNGNAADLLNITEEERDSGKVRAPDERSTLLFDNEDPIYPTLTDDRQKELIAWLDNETTQVIDARSDMVQKVDRWYQMWRGVKESKDYPWKGASNHNTRIIFDNVQRVHAKYVDTFLNQESYMFIRGEEDNDVPLAQSLDQFMQYKMRDVIKAYYPLSDAMLQAVLYGTAFVKVFWDKKENTIRERQKEQVEVPVVINGQQVTDPETGQPFTQTQEREMVVARTNTIYDDPRIETIPNLLDVIWPQDATDPQTAQWIIHRKQITLDELKRKALNGIYDKEAVERIEISRLNRNQDADPTQERINFERTKLDAQGQEQLHHDIARKFEIYEVQMKYPIEEDGLEEECIFTYIPGTDFLLRGHLIESLDGSRSIHVLKHVRVQGEMQGIGLAELLFDYNETSNTTFNMAFDNLHLSMIGMMRMTEQARAQNDGKIYPTKTWIAEAGEVEWMSGPPVNPQAFQGLDVIQNLVSKVTGVTDLARGLPEENRPVARVTALRSNQIASFFRVQTRFMGESLSRVYQSIMNLYMQFGEDELRFRVTGEDDDSERVFQTLSREEISFTPDIRVKAIDIEKAVLRENRLQLWPLIMNMSQVPFQQQVALSGINLREALIRILKDFEIEEVDKIILDDDQVKQLQEQQLRVMAEAQAQAAANEVRQGVDQMGGQVEQVLQQMQGNQQETT